MPVEIDENTLIYENVVENVSIEYIQNDNQLKETIIIEDALDSYGFNYSIQHDENVSLSLVENQIEIFDNITEEVIGYITPPYAYDSSEKVIETYACSYNLIVKEENSLILEVKINDKSFLEKAVFPIYLDPTVNLAEFTDYRTYGMNASDSYIRVRDDEAGTTTGEDSAAIKFEFNKLIEDKMYPNSAKLYLYLNKSYNDSDSESSDCYINVFPITQDWSDNSSSIPSYGEKIGSIYHYNKSSQWVCLDITDWLVTNTEQGIECYGFYFNAKEVTRDEVVYAYIATPNNEGYEPYVELDYSVYPEIISTIPVMNQDLKLDEETIIPEVTIYTEDNYTINCKYSIDGNSEESGTMTIELIAGENTTVSLESLDVDQLIDGTHYIDFYIDYLGYEKMVSERIVFNVNKDEPTLDNILTTQEDDALYISVNTTDIDSNIESYDYAITKNINTGEELLVEDSGWVSDAFYTLPDILYNQQYTIEVTMKDYGGTESTLIKTITTEADVPTISVSDNNEQLILNITDNNPVDTLYQIKCDDYYINELGALSDIPIWMTLEDKTLMLEGLDYNTDYEFKVKAKNQEGIETDNSEAVLGTITVTPPPAISINQVIGSTNDANVVAVNSEHPYVQSTIAAGGYFSLMVTTQGAVEAIGENYWGNNNVSDWTDIVDIAAGPYHTVGLSSNGTAAAIGYDIASQCSVDDWTDITQVEAGYYHTLGLKSDGTVEVTGYSSEGQCNITDWSDITQIAVGETHTVGLKSDGTVVAAGATGSDKLDVDDWEDIVQVTAGKYHTVGLKADGTVVAVGPEGSEQIDVSDWEDIIQISAGYYHTVGLKADGTVVAVGQASEGDETSSTAKLEVSDWEDIIQVAAGDQHTIGLKADGTVVSVGRNWYGQCNVVSFTDISTAPNYNIAYIDTDQILLRWADVNYEGICTYEVEIDGVIIDNKLETTYIHKDLGANTRHSYRIRALYGNVAGEWSDLMVLTTNIDFPSVPTGISGSAGDTTIMVTWDEDPNITEYEIIIDDILIATTTTNYYMLSNLSPESTHTYKIRGLNQLGISDYSDEQVTTTYLLATPVITAESISETAITLTWDSIEDASSYQINVDGTTINLGSLTSYTHSNIEAYTFHTYEVIALNDSGESAWSDELPLYTLPIKPGTPEIIGAVATDETVLLGWYDVENAIGYDLELDGVVIENFTDTTYLHEGLVANIEHNYRICATNQFIAGEWSAYYNIWTLPGDAIAPENIVISTIGTVSTISWDEVDGTVKYEIEVDGEVINVGKETSYIHRGLTLGQEYVYRVRSTNDIETGEWSGYIINNSIQGQVTNGEDLELGLTASNITDFSQYELSVFYNEDVLHVSDLCAKTEALELSEGVIEEEGITITSFEEGKVTFIVTKEIQPGYDWTGIINNIVFEGQVTGGTTIDYTVYVIPE